MNNNRKFIIVMFTLLFVILLVACKNTSEKPETNNVTDVAEDVEEDIENEEQDDTTDQTTVEKNNQDNNPSESTGNIKITNGEDAVQYLKEHLKEGTNEDISFGTDGKLETDSIGSYYTVQLVDTPLRLSGKTGNLGYYKVYQDGQYEPYETITSNNGNKVIVNNKNKYLKILNDTDTEIKEFLNSSESTTTLDMEEDESHRYKTWDVKLNEIYGVLIEQLSKEQLDKLREEQRDWITYRDKTAKEASLKYKGGSMESLEYVATQATLTRERCYELVEEYMS